MSHDPVRWKDAEDAPVDVRDLLRKTSDLGPMPKDVRAAILATLPEGSPPGSPGEAPSTATGVATSKGLLGAALLASAVGVVAIVVGLAWSHRSSPRSPAPAPIATSAAPARTLPDVVHEAPTTTDTTSEVVDSTATPPPSSDAPAPTVDAPRGGAKPAPTSDLATENALIGHARSHLASNPTASLAAIDEHARRFPRGELAPEREYLRVNALRRLERCDEARARARTYLTRYPKSPQATTVRSILAELPSP